MPAGNDKLTSSDAAVSVKVVLQLNAHLSVGRLFTEERVFQELVGVGSLGVVFNQTHTDEVYKLL